MAEPSFIKLGYLDDKGTFSQQVLRAQDVVSTDGTNAETHITNAGIHLTAEQVAAISGAVQTSQLGATNGVAQLVGGKVPTSQLPSQALTVADKSVATISALIALSDTDAPLNADVFVNDASADSTVESGWALYRRIATAGGTLSDWTKTQEGEGLDVTMEDAAARSAAALAQSTAETAQTMAENAQETANAASTAASAAGTAAANAQTAANAAQSTASAAQAAANLLDAVYCTSEADMATKNLRTGALVFMAVTD